MLRFGLPTVPADASVYALQVADRFYLLRGVSAGAAGEYAIAVQLATVVFVFVRGFQYAWPPLAYSIDSDAEASRLYSLVTTYFVLATGVVVVAVALLGRWLVRLLAAPEYFGAYRALPWLALGWTLYGLYQVMIVITGRARVTQRNLPAAAAGLAVNVALLFVLVPSGGLGLGLAGAGIALCGAYVAMVAIMHLLTRGRVRGRLPVAAPGPADGDPRGGRRLRRAAAAEQRARGPGRCASLWLALVPALLLATRFFAPHERAQAQRRSWPTAAGAWPPSAPGTAMSRHTPRTRSKTSDDRGHGAGRSASALIADRWRPQSLAYRSRRGRFAHIPFRLTPRSLRAPLDPRPSDCV